MGKLSRQKAKENILVPIIKDYLDDMYPFFSMEEYTSEDGRNIVMERISEIFLATDLGKPTVQKIIKNLRVPGHKKPLGYNVELKAGTYTDDNITYVGYWIGAIFDENNRMFPFEKRQLILDGDKTAIL